MAKSKAKSDPSRPSLKVFMKHKLCFSAELPPRIEVGRQNRGEPAPCQIVDSPDGPRLVVEKQTKNTVSRKHCLLSIQDDARVKIANVSAHVPAFYDRQDDTGVTRSLGLQERITMPSLTMLDPGDEVFLRPPFMLLIGSSSILIEPPGGMAPYESSGELKALSETAPAPGDSLGDDESFPSFFQPSGETKDRNAVLSWLQTTMSVFQQSASSPSFLPQAARAIIDTVGLDMAGILTREGGEWKTETVVSRREATEAAWNPSSTILDHVLKEKRTFRQVPDLADNAQSLLNVSALVAAPMLDLDGNVMGAVYGDRRTSAGSNRSMEISELEAKLVELLACGVAAGLARLEQEQAALAARVRFEQFFSPQLSQQLEADPTMLEGRDAEVTLLFADIVGFSRVSERMGPKATVAWVNTVMDTLSDCVMEESGVLVDYTGDELFAMWGAPTAIGDHAARACRTALAMQRALEQVNQKWQEQVGEPTKLGIGINTGIARVGNVGSRRKFKYGPLGNAVNLASRVQGATKFLRSPLLITSTTAEKLGDEFHTRRLCKVKVVNIQQPVDIYEVVGQLGDDWQPDDDWDGLREQYERALASFEKADFTSAARTLGALAQSHPDDGPSVLLLSRVAKSLMSDLEDDFDPVWELGGK